MEWKGLMKTVCSSDVTGIESRFCCCRCREIKSKMRHDNKARPATRPATKGAMCDFEFAGLFGVERDEFFGEIGPAVGTSTGNVSPVKFGMVDKEEKDGL